MRFFLALMFVLFSVNSYSAVVLIGDDFFIISGPVKNESSNNSIVGSWINTTTADDFLAFNFYSDSSYAHMEVDLDDFTEESGMEWGAYALDSSTGQLTVNQIFDNNGDTGLSGFAGTSNLFASVDGGVLTLSVDEDGDGTIDSSLAFDRVVQSDFVGSWVNTTTEDDLLALNFYADGSYAHLEIDFDDPSEMSGMEWGTYAVDQSTGKVTVTQTFDNNGDTGLSDFAGTANLYAEVVGDILTASFDDDGDGTIDGTIEFHRADSALAIADGDLLTNLLSGLTVYTSTFGETGTLESWTFSEDVTSVDWAELIGGSDSGQSSFTLTGLTLVFPGAYTEEVVTILGVTTDYIVVDLNGREDRLYFDRAKAEAYYGIMTAAGLTSLLSGQTLYTTIYTIPGTLESWTFNAGVTSAVWEELVGGSESGTSTIVLGDMSLTVIDSDGEIVISITEITPDYLVLDGVDVPDRLYFDRSKAEEYYGVSTVAALTSLLSGQTLYTTIYTIPGTLESWTFNTDVTSGFWVELVGGSDSGTTAVAVGDMTLTLTDADGQLIMSVTEITSDYIALEGMGVSVRLYYDRTKAEEYFVFGEDWLNGRTLYQVWFGGGEQIVDGQVVDIDGDVPVVIELNFSAGTVTAIGLLNAVGGEGYYVNGPVAGSIVLSGTPNPDFSFYNRFKCGNADYLVTEYYEDGMVNNVDLFFFDGQMALDFAAGLSSSIPNACPTIE